jgi:uncharacterized membrane protein YhiD involved in acid resistance
MAKEIFTVKRKRMVEKMHREIIICIIIIIIIIVLNIITQNYTKESIDILNEKLETLKVTLTDENKEEIEKNINSIMEEWQNRFQKLAYFIEHDELEKVETELTVLRANIQTEEYEDAITEIDKSIFILNHIKDKFRLEIKNIF